MRKFISLLLVLASFQCLAQVSKQFASSATPMSSVSDHDYFKDRSKMYFDEELYIIDGKKVIGSPFLYHDWLSGVVTTEDGRVFNGYLLKYNAYHQTVFFNNGMDSLEIVDPIKQFSLIVQPGDSSSICTFINANQIHKDKKPLYYELMLENPTYQLLKYNRKRVADATKSLPVSDGRKVFDLEITFYIFNKATNKLTGIKASGTNIAKILDLTDDKIQNLNLASYDFSTETDIIRFFRMYFNSHSN